MKKFLAFAVALGMVCGAVPAHAQLSTTVKWHGPPCTDVAVNFPVCSIDPPASSAPGPCYVSHDASYIPNDLQLDTIGMCQAAKSAIIASPSTRLSALGGLSGWILRTEAQAQANPSALVTVPQANEFPDDINNINADLKIYQTNPTEANWSLLSSDLQKLTQDAQIWGA